MQGFTARVYFVFCLMLVAVGATPSQATQWQVSGHGLDSNSCTGASPCRSISEAVRRAKAGDTIYVLPGVYGDLNENGVLGEPGEENGEVGYGCYCVVKVDKAVTIISQGGALLTRIDVRAFADAGTLIHAVRITADHAVFGLPQQGFQISGSNYFAVRLDASHATLSGNIASGSESGFYVTGSYNKLDNDLSINGSGAGFNITGSYNTIVNSLASGGGAGFQVSADTGPGIGNAFTNDISSGNVVGFNLFAPVVISGSEAIGNWESAVAIRGNGPVTVNNSNFFGNGTQTATNCAIENFTGAAATINKSYWGAATGPGAEPADRVCDYVANVTKVPTFQSTSYAISYKP
jgi:parallel beta-helix repeat protein